MKITPLTQAMSVSRGPNYLPCSTCVAEKRRHQRRASKTLWLLGRPAEHLCPAHMREAVDVYEGAMG